MFPGVFEDLLGVRLFGYISFRMAMAALTGFALALALGPKVIAWLRAHRVGEPIEEDSDDPLARISRQMGKHGTTTMGGSFLVCALLVSVLLWARLDNPYVVLGVLLTAGLAAVGFVDDFRKLTSENNRGLSRSAKMIGLTAVTAAALAALVFYAFSSGRTTLMALYPPFFKNVSIPLGTLFTDTAEPWLVLVALGPLLFIAFEWLVVVGTANAANITDGLDGLAVGCMVISGGVLSIFCYVTGRPDWTHYLNLPHVSAASEMAVVGGALCGACLGFLWFNAFPAKVFMGDSGSLPLGGLLAWMALISKQELVLPLIAAVFVMELGSSWLQTAGYRRTGRRILSYAPIHHGLQLYGKLFRRDGDPWHEVTVTVRFWIIAAVCGMTSLALLKVR